MPEDATDMTLLQVASREIVPGKDKEKKGEA
jgi:hypothetical protein